MTSVPIIARQGYIWHSTLCPYLAEECSIVACGVNIPVSAVQCTASQRAGGGGGGGEREGGGRGVGGSGWEGGTERVVCTVLVMWKVKDCEWCILELSSF